MKNTPRNLLVASLATAAILASAHAQRQSVPSAVAPDNSEETYVLDPFKVTAEGEAGYGVSTSTSATKLNTPLKDVPQTINVVTSAFIRDTGSTSLSEAVRYVPNVSKRGVGAIPNQLFVRGFLVQNLFQDGFRLPSVFTRGDLVNVERIEVIKGPASAVSGRGEVGGAVNFITKRPLSTRQHEITTILGSYDFYRATADSTGPLNESKTLRYRLIGAYEDSQTERIADRTHKLVAYPTVEWDISERTQLSYSAMFLKTKGVHTSGTGILISSRVSGNPPGLREEVTRRDFNISEPWENLSEEAHSNLVSVTHRLNEALVLRQGVQFGSTTVVREFGNPNQRVTLQAGTGDILIARTYRKNLDTISQYFLQGDLVAKFNFLGGEHAALVGYEYGNIDTDSTTLSGSLAAINYINPVYGARPTNVTVNNANVQSRENYGFPIQQQSSFFNGKLKLMAGIRYDKASASTRVTAGAGADIQTRGEYTASPRYGITLAPTRWLSLYAVRSEDKQQPETVNRYAFTVPKPGDPRLTETITAARDGLLNEAGFKAELFNGQLSLTASYYHLRRNNQVLNIINLDTDGTAYNLFFHSAGESIRGVEVQAFGSIGQRLDLMVSYAKTESSNALATRVVSLTSVPDYDFSAFFNYRFHQPGKDGMSVRAGYKKIGRMWGTVDNFFQLPPQDKADAGLRYTRGRYSFDLQVKNLFDDSFIESAAVIVVIAHTPTRQINGSFTYRF